MKYLKIFGYVVLFSILTILTQVGGVILLICLPLIKICNKISSGSIRILSKILLPIGTYLLICLFIIPSLANYYGRVPLPLFCSPTMPLQPRNVLTVLLNRHYVTHELKELLIQSAVELNKSHKGSVLNYLDANFPFCNSFPLLPHLSHNDGRKVDLSFLYFNSKTNEISNSTPSFIGYGAYTSPNKNEENTAEMCKSQGFWQYNILENVIPMHHESILKFDKIRTKKILQILLRSTKTKKIFIEPYLKSRLNMDEYDKIRFHGCHAIRHDDHLHLEAY